MREIWGSVQRADEQKLKWFLHISNLKLQSELKYFSEHTVSLNSKQMFLFWYQSENEHEKYFVCWSWDAGEMGVTLYHIALRDNQGKHYVGSTEKAMKYEYHC